MKESNTIVCRCCYTSFFPIYYEIKKYDGEEYGIVVCPHCGETFLVRI